MSRLHKRSRLSDFHPGVRLLSRKEEQKNDTSFRKKDTQDTRDEYGLTAIQMRAFRKIFHLYDIQGGGTIHADEFDSTLKAINIHLNKEQLLNVLHIIDKSSDEDIDFKKFLILITSVKQFLETAQEQSLPREGAPAGKVYSRVILSALAKFMRKSALSSLSQLERIFKMEERKAPHVLRHFTFGARLMGLSEKELTRRQQATLHTVAKNSNKDSPFAKPLFRIDKRPHTEELSKWKGTGKIRLSVIVDKDLVDKTSTEFCTPPMSRSKTPLIRTSIVTEPIPPISLEGAQKRDSSFSNIEQLPQINPKVEKASTLYHKRRISLKGKVVHTFNFRDISAIKSIRLRHQFKDTLEAYGFKPTKYAPSSSTG